MNTVSFSREQDDAISAVYGPILVSAGAGSGKTTVLTARIKKLVTEYNVSPERILVVTFTNRAANEIKSRLTQALDDVTGLWSGTFHSLCMKMLKIDGHLIQCGNEIKVIDKLGQRKIVKQLFVSKFLQAADILEAIDAYKNTGAPLRGAEMQSAYHAYEKAKKEAQVMDYSDLLINANRLLVEHPEIAKKYQEKFEFICIDEYQDTNEVQNTWIRHLINTQKPNLFCVGDEDQSIFEWRGSDPKLMRDFHLQFASATKLTLETNYRSTGSILNTANHLIKNNKVRTPKVLKAFHEVGDPVVIYELQDELAEARHVIKKLHALDGVSAILCRTVSQMKTFEDTCRALSIKCQIVGDSSFYERQEVKDVLVCMRFILNPEAHFAHAVKLLCKDVTARQLEQIYDASLYGVLNTARREPKLHQLFHALDSALAQHTPVDILTVFLEKSGYMEIRRNDPTKNAEQRIENVLLIVNQASKCPTLTAFNGNLEHDTLAGPSNLLIMTLHSAKGLEFDNVALPGWEERLLPHVMSLTEGKVEEERRLAYVGITRAKRNLFITLTRNRFMISQNKAVRVMPSRFISELPLSVKWVSCR